MMPKETIKGTALAMLEGGPEAFNATAEKLRQASIDKDDGTETFLKKVFLKWARMLDGYLETHKTDWEDVAYHDFMTACMYAEEGNPEIQYPTTEEDAEMEQDMRKEPKGPKPD